MSKYNSKKCNGYDSIKEWKRSLELKQMQKSGLIRSLEEKKVFELIPAYVEIIKQFSKKDWTKEIKPKIKTIEQPCTYISDFVYELFDMTDEWHTVVEDVKGMKTEVYRIKKKLMLHVHGIKIRET